MVWKHNWKHAVSLAIKQQWLPRRRQQTNKAMSRQQDTWGSKWIPFSFGVEKDCLTDWKSFSSILKSLSHGLVSDRSASPRDGHWHAGNWQPSLKYLGRYYRVGLLCYGHFHLCKGLILISLLCNFLASSLLPESSTRPVRPHCGGRHLGPTWSASFRLCQVPSGDSGHCLSKYSRSTCVAGPRTVQIWSRTAGVDDVTESVFARLKFIEWFCDAVPQVSKHRRCESSMFATKSRWSLSTVGSLL